MHLRCRFLPQVEMQLNLQKSAITPNISAYSHVHVPHNFMHNPLYPLGCPVLAHYKPDKREIWADYTINAWNVVTSMEHHRAFNVYRKHTRAVTPEDTVLESSKRITYAFNANSNMNESEQMESLKQLAIFFTKIA